MGGSFAPAGTTLLRPLPNEEALESAKHYLSMMVFDVDTRPNGFDYDGIIALVGNFLKFVKYFRGPGEIPSMDHMWRRRQTLRPVPPGRKRTEHLVITVKQLRPLLSQNGQSLEGMYSLYEELRLQMWELVTDFRMKMEAMKHPDLQRFTLNLDRQLLHARSKYF